MSNRSIVSVRTDNALLNQALAAAKQNLDNICGRAKGSTQIPPLSANPTNAEIATVLNMILERLQSE